MYNKKMSNKYQEHSTHEVHINWRLTNAHGNPALCCNQCINKKGSRRGQSKYIDWIKSRDIEFLQKLGIEERF